MELKIKIKTPKGAAAGTEKKIRNWVLPFGVTPIIETNADDSEIIWTVITDVRRAFKIQRNVARFEYIVDFIMNKKMFKKMARRAVGEQGVKELEDMLVNQTTIKILKE